MKYNLVNVMPKVECHYILTKKLSFVNVNTSPAYNVTVSEKLPTIHDGSGNTTTGQAASHNT